MLNKFILKGFLIIIPGVFFMVGCEEKLVEPEQKATFIKYYGGGVDQEGSVVEQTPDGGYVYTGTTNSFGNGGTDMYVVKTDAYGNMEWDKTFGGSGDDAGRCVRNTPDGGFIVVGTYADVTLANPDNVYLVKLDGSGNMLWSRTYGLTTKNDFGYSVQNTMDGGYVIIGTTENVNVAKNGGTGAFDITDIYCIKTDNLGNKEWEQIDGFNGQDRGSAVQQLSDDVFYLSGYRLGNANDMIIIRGREQGTSFTPNLYLDKSAGKLNELTISSATDMVLNNGNLFVVGNTLSGSNGTDIYLMKIDANGSKVWFKTFGGGVDETVISVQMTSDGGFVLLGNTKSMGSGGSDIYLVKVSPDGNMEWSQTYGGDGNDSGNSVKQTSDGGYIISGTIAFGGSGTGANNVMALIKTTSDGKLIKE